MLENWDYFHVRNLKLLPTNEEEEKEKEVEEEEIEEKGVIKEGDEQYIIIIKSWDNIIMNAVASPISTNSTTSNSNRKIRRKNDSKANSVRNE